MNTHYLLVFLAGVFFGALAVAWILERSALEKKVSETEANLHERFDAVETSLRATFAEFNAKFGHKAAAPAAAVPAAPAVADVPPPAPAPSSAAPSA